MAKVTPRVSIIVPFHFGKDYQALLKRCLTSIETQTFTDYEILMVKYGRAAETQNRGIESAQGKLVKILHMDDYFAYPTALEDIVDAFTPETKWLATGCWHDAGDTLINPHYPEYTHDIHTGNNRIGAPSVVTFRNDSGILMDETLDWLYDTEFYKKLYDKFGLPKILNDFPVVIGLHPHQLTHTISDEQRKKEIQIMTNRYA